MGNHRGSSAPGLAKNSLDSLAWNARGEENKASRTRKSVRTQKVSLYYAKPCATPHSR